MWMKMLIRAWKRPVVAGAAALVVVCAVASIGVNAQAQQSMVIQWQMANLTEDQYRPVWTKEVAAFETLHPGVRIEPILVARKDHWTKFVTAAKAHQAPCVVQVDVASAAYFGYIRPIDKFFNAEPASFRNAWSPDVLAAAKWKGNLYALPTWGGIYGELYNRDLVTQAGLDPNHPPTTWNEYLTWAHKLTNPAKDQYALAILAGPTDTTTRILLMWIWSNGGEAFNKDLTQATFASDPKSLQAIEFYLNLALKEGVAAPGSTTTNYLEQTQLFAHTKIATMRNAYWAVPVVTEGNPTLKGRMFAAFAPMNTNKKVTLATMAADSISADCKYPEMAWNFVKFDNDRVWSVARAQVSDWMPLRNDLINDVDIRRDPMLAQFLEWGKYARTYPLPSPAWADISANDIVNAVQKVLLKQATVKDAFTQLDRELNQKLASY